MIVILPKCSNVWRFLLIYASYSSASVSFLFFSLLSRTNKLHYRSSKYSRSFVLLVMLMSFSLLRTIETMLLLCCFNTVSDVPGSGSRERPRKRHRCTDSIFLSVFIIFWIGLVFVGTYALLIGNPLRMIHGSDSFGNVCGHINELDEKLPFAGLDLRHRPWVWIGFVSRDLLCACHRYLFHLNQADPKNSIKICVTQCPGQALTNLAEVYNFYTQTNSSLCRYDFDFSTSAAVTRASNTGGPQTQPYIQNRLPSRYAQLNVPVYSQAPNMSESGVCPVLPVYRT